MQSLVSAMAVCQRSSGKSNGTQRHAAYSRFVTWLNEMGASPSMASPAHVISYLHDFSQKGTFMTPMGPRCAPGSVKNHIGLLRKGMALYAARCGPYDPTTGQGVSYPAYCDFRKSYIAYLLADKPHNGLWLQGTRAALCMWRTSALVTRKP
jgi:hypothetical protein